MTASDLIKKLQSLPPDIKIIVRGYEGGYNDVLKLVERKIIIHPKKEEWYYGEYDDNLDDSNTSAEVKAMELWGENTRSKHD
jgi:hypothetical protein